MNVIQNLITHVLNGYSPSQITKHPGNINVKIQEIARRNILILMVKLMTLSAKDKLVKIVQRIAIVIRNLTTNVLIG